MIADDWKIGSKFFLQIQFLSLGRDGETASFLCITYIYLLEDTRQQRLRKGWKSYLERTSVISSLAIKTLIKNHVSSIYILFKSKLIFLNSKSPINFYG